MILPSSLLLLSLSFALAFGGALNNNLPELHKIYTHTFEKPYSCGGNYQVSGLYLSSLDKSEPTLLYNGACGSEPYIGVSLAGDDLGFSASFGDFPLQNMTAQECISRDRSFSSSAMPIKKNNTYSFLISRRNLRTLLAVRVTELNEGKSCTIEYAVLSFSINKAIATSPGFTWNGHNHF